MKRKIIATIATTLLLIALLPAAAFAQASATATLDAGSREVFPGTRTAQVTVQNTDSGLFQGVGGGAINWIRITLPTSHGVVLNVPSDQTTIDGPGNWSGRITQPRNAVVFTGSNLNALQSGTFNLPINVQRPADRDLTAPWVVAVSTNSGDDVEPAATAPGGSLNTVIRILQVLSGAVQEPAAARANEAVTGGQDNAGYRVLVRNHAQNTVPVGVNLTLTGGDTIRTSPGVLNVPGNPTGATPFDFGINVGNTTGDTTRVHQARASKPDDTATSPQLGFGIRVQLRPALQFQTNTFGPRYVQPGSSQRWSANFTKANTPAITELSGTFEFASTVAPIEQTTFGGSNQPAQTIRTEITTVSGPDDDHPGRYLFRITDGNGFTFDHTPVTHSSILVTIDGIVPVFLIDEVRLPLDRENQRQEQAKDTDNVQVFGRVIDRNPDPDGISVKLVQNNSNEISPSQITTQSTSDGLSFTATFSNVEFHPQAVSFHAFADGVDLAGNEGDFDSTSDAPVFIDRVHPTLQTRVVNGDMVLTGFTSRDYGDTTALVVNIEEDFLVRGGCDRRNWALDANLISVTFITSVRYADGSPCQPGQGDPDGANVRVLVLNQELPRGFETTVTWDPDVALTNDLLKDGAARYIDDRETQAIRDFIAPALPVLDFVQREGGDEDATFDEDKYWVRTGGANDVRVGVRVDADGTSVRIGDRLQVLDAAGNVLAQSDSASENGQLLEVGVPLPNVASGSMQEVPRFVRLVSGTGFAGEAKQLDIVVDRITPDIASVTRTGDDTVSVTFSEVIWEGNNAAGYWQAYERDDAGFEYAATVRRVDGERESRTLTVDFPGFGDFHAVEYEFDPDTGSNPQIYRDRAGNELAAFVRVTA